MSKKSRPIREFLKIHLFLVIAIVVFIILRIPSLFEPHWYGDEGIYASIAYALEQGKKLYVDVYDNRLPGIYFLYSLASSEYRQVSMRVLSLIAGIVTLTAIYAVGKRLQLKTTLVIALGIATWFLGTPRMEGNIANTENFFLPLTIWGVWFGISQKRFQLLMAGILFGLAFLIKFPPIFTFFALAMYVFFSERKIVTDKIIHLLVLGLGFVLPIFAVFTFMFFQGNLKETVQFGLLNNSSYVTEYSNEGITILFKLVGLGVVLFGISVLYFLKRISGIFYFLLLLLTFDYFAALFSGRKYEHYLLQVVPALALMSAQLGSYLIGEKGKVLIKIFVLVSAVLLFQIGREIFYMGMGTALQTKIITYYKEFTLASLNIHYDPSMPFTFYREPARLKISQYVTDKYKTKNIYFFSDESWIYDYSQINPPTFFVARYHQYLIPNGVERVVSDLRKSQPDVIAVDKKIEMTSQLDTYLKEMYIKDAEDSYFIYYTK